MTFKEAAAFALPFGKHTGERIDDVARTDSGLKYLDWLRNTVEPGNALLVALGTYLEDPAIRRELEEVIE